MLFTNAGGPGAPGPSYPLVLKYYGVPQSVLYLENRCLNDATTAFLVTGERPRTDRACAAEPSASGAGRPDAP
ncbi:hypothetical protein OIE75_31705 [Streptomyces sp. NBC_01723]|uniref:hypothetical protein n=1 Tax=unclassified Streptomyces TaxID=2593676 RepID=UPI002E334AF6|nr:hypothetical protein [Streptomyces sp. NBC_01723]